MSSPFIFLDRDGVINEELGEGRYISTWEQVRFIPGSLEAISQLTKAKRKIIIISNQAGVGRGMVSERQLAHLTQQMLKEIEKKGGRIRGIFYCTHQPDFDCPCRKPKTALFRKAVNSTQLNWTQCVVVGDTLRDIQAGKTLGCRTILTLSGKTEREDLNQWPIQPDLVCENLLAAVPLILENG